MKTLGMWAVAASCVLATSCGSLGAGTASTSSTGNAVSDVISVLGNAETIGNVISSVIGTNTLTQKQLYGTWKYYGPGCAFTSSSTLAKAGGEVVASEIKSKMKSQYQQLGLTAKNTQITFNEDGTFAATVDGKSFSGNYTYNEKTNALKLSGLLLSLNGYATRNSTGVAVLFESKKLLTLLQTLASLSGNSTLTTISDISKNYDGVRMGFDMAK